jgi:hypothetical protein
MIQFTMRLVTSVCIGTTVLMAGCARPHPISPGTQELGQEISLPRGYARLDAPLTFGDRPFVGAVVTITQKDGLRYQTSLSTCGIDQEVLVPSTGPVVISSFTLNDSMSANATVQFAKLVTLAPQAKMAKRVSVDVGPSTVETLAMWDVISNARKNKDKVDTSCKELLNQPNVYWITDAIKTKSFKLTFYDDKNAQIKVTVDNLPNFISSVAANAQGSATLDGKAEIDLPVYVAFRDAPPIQFLSNGAVLAQQTSLRQPKHVFGLTDQPGSEPPETGKATPLVFGEEVYQQYSASQQAK